MTCAAGASYRVDVANLLYRWFRLGGIPKAMRPILEDEGIVLLDEGVSGSVGYRNFRAPGKRYGRRRSGVVAALVITELRFAVFAFGNPLVNLPLERAMLDLLHLDIDGRGRLTLEFDAATFNPEWSGTVSARLASERARGFLRRLQAVR